MKIDINNKQFINQLHTKQQEPKWLSDFRYSAYNQIDQLPLPVLQKTKIDRWNFTQFQLDDVSTSIKEISDLPEELRSFLFDVEESNILIQRNTEIVYHKHDQKNGVIFTDLATAAREHEDLVKKYFMTDGISIDEHRLTALHAAFFHGGVFLYVPKNQELTLPFQSLFWSSGKNTGLFPHVLIVAEENSRVEFVANFVGEGAVNNTQIEVFVGQNAQVRVADVNHLGTDTVSVTYRRALVERDGQMEWIVSDLGEGRIISQTNSHLRGPGANAEVKSVALGANEMRSNITAEALHRSPYTKSNILSRCVMKDQATSILNSITKIEKGAHQSDGQQSGKILMLNQEARGDANPILLIDENDVVAGHAASVGQIDPLILFYLMSRGISRVEAEKLIIYGFLDAVIKEIPSQALRDTIFQVIERKFEI